MRLRCVNVFHMCVTRVRQLNETHDKLKWEEFLCIIVFVYFEKRVDTRNGLRDIIGNFDGRQAWVNPNTVEMDGAWHWLDSAGALRWQNIPERFPHNNRPVGEPGPVPTGTPGRMVPTHEEMASAHNDVVLSFLVELKGLLEEGKNALRDLAIQNNEEEEEEEEDE